MTEKLQPSFWRRLRNSWHAYRGALPGTFDLLPDGFVFANRGEPVRMRWDEITRIDAGTRDCLTLDVFFTVLHTSTKSVTVDELVDGFRQMEDGVFERWPNVRSRWLALQGGPPRLPQYEILWRRAG